MGFDVRSIVIAYRKRRNDGGMNGCAGTRTGVNLIRRMRIEENDRARSEPG